MGGVFSTKSNQQYQQDAAVDDIDQAEWKMGVMRDNLDKYAKTLQKQIDSTKEKIRESMKNKKIDHAKKLLLLNKARQKAMESALDKKFNCIQQLENIRSAKITKDYVHSIELTNNALKKFTEEYTPEKVEALMEENRAQAEALNEMGELLGIPITAVDDSSLENELENYMKSTETNDEVKAEEQEETEEKPSKPQKVAALA